MVDLGMSNDFDLDTFFERKTGGRGNTWYNNLPDDAKPFIDALTVRAVERGTPPNAAAVVRQLHQQWGFRVSRNPVRFHFQRAIDEASNHGQ